MYLDYRLSTQKSVERALKVIPTCLTTFFLAFQLVLKRFKTVVAFKTIPLMLFCWMKFHSTKLDFYNGNPKTHLSSLSHVKFMSCF